MIVILSIQYYCFCMQINAQGNGFRRRRPPQCGDMSCHLVIRSVIATVSQERTCMYRYGMHKDDAHTCAAHLDAKEHQRTAVKTKQRSDPIGEDFTTVNSKTS